MNRNGFFEAILIILLVITIIYGSYYLYQNFPRESIQLIEQKESEIKVINQVPSKQFYDNMRYSNRKINYHISELCPESKTKKMLEALDLLESKTILIFNPTSKSESVLNILCSDISPQAEEENHFVAGEGGPSRVINSTLYSVILEGKIALYRDGNCDNANIAIHETLHALGFDHNNNKKSVLYPTLKCDQEIDLEIIESINKLYRTESLPDLLFEKVNATKSGRYLNFHIEVLNRGLVNSKSVIVGIYADGEFIDLFDLEDISIGSKKIIDVQNLKVPLNAKEIKFVIDYENKINEISEDNNLVSFSKLE